MSVARPPVKRSDTEELFNELDRVQDARIEAYENMLMKQRGTPAKVPRTFEWNLAAPAFVSMKAPTTTKKASKKPKKPP